MERRGFLASFFAGSVLLADPRKLLAGDWPGGRKYVENALFHDGDFTYRFERPFNEHAKYARPRFYSGRIFWGKRKDGPWIKRVVPAGESSAEALLEIARELGDARGYDWELDVVDGGAADRVRFTRIADRLVGMWVGKYGS